MKKSLTIIFTALSFLAQAQLTTITPGTIAPAIKLPNVNNKEVSFGNYPEAKGFIVVFTCNTCPYAKAYEQKIIGLNNKYTSLGYPVIAINPNDPDLSPGDSFDKMKERAKLKKYSFPYLFDKDQVVTNAYGARNTPHLFVVVKTDTGNLIQYTGAIDNDPENSNPNRVNYIEEAITSLTKGEKPAITVTKAIGCKISRKKS